jgi:hypothetical protein
MGPLHHPLKILIDGALIESLIGKKETILGEKPSPAPLYPSQIKYRLPFCCITVSKVRKWNLTTSAMAQPKVQDTANTYSVILILLKRAHAVYILQAPT